MVIDSHQFDDNRISKHINTVGSTYPVFRLNFNFFAGRPLPNDPSAIIFDYTPTKNPYVNGAMFAMGVSLGNWTGKALAALESGFITADDDVLLHVHDPYLLGLAVKLQRGIPRSRIVYDRHEYYETWKNRLGISVPGYFENRYGKWPDELIFISGNFKQLPNVFAGKRISVIPNYPLSKNYSREVVQEKIDSFDGVDITAAYFGVLNIGFDRDIELMFKVMDELMAANSRLSFVLAGRIYDDRVKKMIAEMSERFGDRVMYLGEIPYHAVLERTQRSHLGFFLLRPDSHMWDEDRPVSPNKVYEYLLSGTVPVIRACLDDGEAIGRCSLTFGKDAETEDIVREIQRLMTDLERMKGLMLRCYETGLEYSWENVSGRYLECYERLFQSMAARAIHE